MPRKPTSALVDLLLEEGLLSKKRAKQIIKTVGRSARSSTAVILEENFLTADELGSFMDSLGIERIFADTAPVDWDAVDQIGLDVAREQHFLPIKGVGKATQVAVPDPFDSEVAGQLSEKLDREVVLVFAPPEEIMNTLNAGPSKSEPGDPAMTRGVFGDFIADETSYKAADILRKFASDKGHWQKPILLIGPGCVGKTHLAQSLHHELSEKWPELNVLLVDGKDVVSTPSLLGGGALPEGLVLDDLEYIAGDPRSEELFMQAFNAVFQQGGPILITAGKPLSSLDELSMRIKASLAISQSVTMGNPRPETQEAIGRQTAAKVGVDPDAVDWVTLISEARGNLRRILEAVESGSMARAATHAQTAGQGDDVLISENGEDIHDSAAAIGPAIDTLEDEAQAIIAEARLAIEEIELLGSLPDESMLTAARKSLDEAIKALQAGDYVFSEQLGMEALEKAAVAHGQAEAAGLSAGETSPAAKLESTEDVSDLSEADADSIIHNAERAVREACDMGAEEYASKELRLAVNGLEEARRLLKEDDQRSRALDEARLALDQARDASRRAKTRKEEARIKQEKEKIRRCQLAIDEARSEFDQLMNAEGDTPIARQLEEVEVFIETAVQYQEVGNIGQALEHVMKARKRLSEIGQEASQRRELREIINEVDVMVRETDSVGEGRNQQLVDIQSALAEAERVLMGDSQDYELGLNWARVARQKALRLTESQSERKTPDGVNMRTRIGPEHSFDTYDVCEANQFVAAIARTAAETPHLVKSPLYIHGEVGVGKTHLLASIFDLARKSHAEKVIFFMTSSDFVDEYREAIARSEASEFRENLRSVHVLILDDIHRVMHDSEGLREFFHTMSAIEDNGGLVVVSAVHPPRRLEIDDKSFRSRLEGGVIAEVKNPSLSARERILRREAMRYDLSIPEEAINLLATMITTNVRDLLGALGKVAARTRANGGPVTGEIIRTVLRDVLPTMNEGDTWHLS